MCGAVIADAHFPPQLVGRLVLLLGLVQSLGVVVLQAGRKRGPSLLPQQQVLAELRDHCPRIRRQPLHVDLVELPADIAPRRQDLRLDDADKLVLRQLVILELSDRVVVGVQCLLFDRLELRQTAMEIDRRGGRRLPGDQQAGHAQHQHDPIAPSARPARHLVQRLAEDQAAGKPGRQTAEMGRHVDALVIEKPKIRL